MDGKFYNNGEILKKETVTKNEHIMLGGGSQCKCYLYDSGEADYIELEDYAKVKTPRRRLLIGQYTSYREVIFVNMKPSKVKMNFDDNRPQQNAQGYWCCKHYELELTVRVLDPVKVIKQDICDVNKFIAFKECEIREQVLRCKTGGELRTVLNKWLKDSGLYLDHVSVTPSENSRSLTTEQMKHNARLNDKIAANHQNKLVSIHNSGRREEQKKDALVQVDIEKLKLVNIKKLELSLKYTEKQVIMNAVLSTLRELNIPNRERTKGMVILANLFGVELPQGTLQMLNEKKNKHNYKINLP